MRAVTALEMNKIDSAAINEFGIPGVVLMENAGLRVVDVAARVMEGACGKRVVVLAGKGNNGGDGFVAARHLYNMGARVKVFLFSDPSSITGDARINLDIWQKLGGEIYAVVKEKSGSKIDDTLRNTLLQADLVVDAIFGTGFKGAARGVVAEVIKFVNECGQPVVAVDIPSGLEADTGKVAGPCVKAVHTVTFGLPKIGLLVEPGATYAGQLTVADISIPRAAVDSVAKSFDRHKYLLTKDLVSGWFAPRPREAHKGDFGRVFVLAGSPGMTGAAYLSAHGTLLGGAGLVTLGIPRSLNLVLETKLTEVMTLPLPETERGTISMDAVDILLDSLKRSDVLVMGPGLSMDAETCELVRQLLLQVTVPCVVDADAINALAGHLDVLQKAKGQVVITPHPGEMGRLLKISAGEVQANRVDCVCRAAEEWNSTVLLKGARTLIATRDLLYINPTGNPGMATGGSGDVLSGLIAAFVAQGLAVPQAAAAGAYIHGAAGDMAADQKGYTALIAGDILRYLPEVLRKICEDNT